MIPDLSVKYCLAAIVLITAIGILGTTDAMGTATDSDQSGIIEETGTIYATDSGVIFDADSGTVYDLQGDNLLEHAGERAVVTGSLTTGGNGESILTIDTLEIEQLPADNEEQPEAEEMGAETTTQDPNGEVGSEAEGAEQDDTQAEAPQQN